MKKASIWWQLLVLFLSAAIAAAVNADTADSFSLARAPQRSEIATIRDWQPLADYLTREINSDFQLKTYSSRADFEQSLIRGEPDFVFLSPYYHTVAHKRHGYIPLIRSSKELKGILVVRRDSPFQSVQDLDGKTFAFPSPNAFAASLYMRALLKEHEHINLHPIYVETHDNVYRNVLIGRVDASGGVVRTFDQEPSPLRDQLRIIFETPATPSHPLSVHPRVPATVRDAVAEAFLNLQTTDEGRELLGRLKIREPARADQESDYSSLIELGLDKYGTIVP